jgi:hypothetical protein
VNFHMSSHHIFMKAMVHLRPVSHLQDIMRFACVVVLGGTLLLNGCDKAPSAVAPAAASTNCNDGAASTSPVTSSGSAYNVIVRGDFFGSGTASISTTTVQVSANVTDASGNVGTLAVTLPVVNQRFAGSATVIGQAINVSGRVDPADSSGARGSVLRSTRLVATFATTDGKSFGRIAGQPPVATNPVPIPMMGPH